MLIVIIAYSTHCKSRPRLVDELTHPRGKAIFLDAIKEQMKDQTEAISPTPVLHSAPGSGNIHFVQLTCSGKFEVSLVMQSENETEQKQLDILYSSRTASHAMTCKLLHTL